MPLFTSLQGHDVFVPPNAIVAATEGSGALTTVLTLAPSGAFPAPGGALLAPWLLEVKSPLRVVAYAIEGTGLADLREAH